MFRERGGKDAESSTLTNAGPHPETPSQEAAPYINTEQQPSAPLVRV